jgi:hypothetical protein
MKLALQEVALVESPASVEQLVAFVGQARMVYELHRAVWKFVPKWQNSKTGLEGGGQI